MNIKQLIIASSLAAAGLTVAAQPPQISNARINSAVQQVLQQADAQTQHTPNTPKPNGEEIRKNVIHQLQTMEVLKEAAFKAGLNKDPEVQNQLQNFEAQFYASQYAAYLERTTEVDEAAVRKVYDQQTRVVKIEQVSFKTESEAKQAQALLLKGMSFEELMKRYPNPEQAFNGFVSINGLAPAIASLVSQMTRGQITAEPLAFNGKYYLLKLAAEEHDPKAPPFEQIKDQLTQQARQIQVQAKITELLKANGIEPMVAPQAAPTAP